MAGRRGKGAPGLLRRARQRDAVNAFRTQVIRHWRFALRRRSQRSRVTWERMYRMARWYPQTRTVHPFPKRASPPGTQGRSPVR